MKKRIPLSAVLFIIGGVGLVPDSAGQVCTLSIGGLNRLRRVTGSIHAECPGIHTAPFGNWGATSNFGQRRNGHQFDGWCHNSYVCDNWGNCRVDCTDGWYEWNSCTDIAQYQPPNCTLYNSATCTQQASTIDVDVLGTVYLRAQTSCPYDSNGDGICDKGGCKDIAGVTASNNYFSLYELDPICCDELVQSVYFPQTTAMLACAPRRCPAAGSAWVKPSFYDSPSWPPKVDGQVAIAVSSGTFSDPNGTCAYYARFDRRYNCY